MIVVRLIGGLGNQFYQYAAGRRLAHKLDTELKLDISGFETYKLHKYALSPFNICENFATPDEIASLKYVRENSFHFDPDILNLDDNVYLDGYWQTEKYFADIANIIRYEFSVRSPLAGMNLQLAQQIDSCQAVSLHIRRGDYVSNPVTNQVHGTCDVDYYRKCVEQLTWTVKNPHLFIFSDEPQWAVENLKLPYPTTVIDHNGPEKNYEDMRLMSQCSHHIIANSSFSWWAAWLNPRKEKKVFAPQQWFRSNEKNTKDLIPKEWSRVGEPQYSVVMANYNNGRYIAEAIESVLNQTMTNWELIIVEDCSTDDSMNVISRYLHDSRIRLIKHENNRGYTAALKTGIANVISKYFGILDSDDCLLSRAVETMHIFHELHHDSGFVYSQFVACHEDLTPRRLGYCDDIPVGQTNLDANVISHFKSFRLSDYLKTEGYDEDILYAEDKDIAYKMEEVTRPIYIDHNLYLFRELPDSQGHDPRKKLIGEQSWERAKRNAIKRRQAVLEKLLGPDAGSLNKVPVGSSEEPPTEPLISIVMANYNNQKYLRDAIGSVLNQTFTKWELIIVEDCSTDDSIKVIKPYLADKRIRLVRHRQNAGYTAALKTGIANVRSEHFALLDSDDCLSRDAVEVMYKEHIAHPDCGMLYSQLVFCDEGLLPYRNGINAAVTAGKTAFQCDTISQLKSFRLADYLKTSGYDEDILYAEDKDIIYKMEEVAKIRFVDKSLYLCRQLSDSQCHSQAKVAAGILSRAKAKINALQRRCLILEKTGNLNFEKLFRQAIKGAKQGRDVAHYFDVITSACENGWLKHLKLPSKVTSAPFDEMVMWIAVNVESRKVLKTIEFDGPVKPRVSVYMVTYNNEKYIRRAIESVLNQTHRKIELIIVDDGSTDNTAAIVASYDDKRIRYYRKPHKNFASGMNHAIIEAIGPYVLGVDSDDYIAPDYIDKMLECAIRNPDVDYFYPAGLQLVDCDDKPIDRWEYLDFTDSAVLPSFLFDNGYSPIPNPGSLKKKSMFKFGLYKELDTVEDFDFLCKNASRIKFKRVDDSSTYFYRRLPSGNTHKFKARNELMARTLNDMVSMYPPEILCPQLAQVSNIQLKTQQYLRYLMTTFNRLSRGSMVQFPEYYRQYADLYKEKLLGLIARPAKTGKPATAPSERNRPVTVFKQGLDYLKAAQPAQALQCFDSLDQAGEKIDNLPFARAIALAQLGKIDHACQACRKQLEINPGHTDASQFMDRISGGMKTAN